MPRFAYILGGRPPETGVSQSCQIGRNLELLEGKLIRYFGRLMMIILQANHDHPPNLTRQTDPGFGGPAHRNIYKICRFERLINLMNNERLLEEIKAD